MSELRTGAIESVYLTPVGERRSAKQRRPAPEAKRSIEPQADASDSDESSTQDSPSTSLLSPLSRLSIDVIA